MQPKILIVEDDASLGFLLKDSLTHEGFVTQLFNDGALAREAFRPSFFDIAVIDVMLPSMDGFELVSQIKQVDPDLPVIFLTAKSTKEDKLKGFGIGADDYLTKPFSVEELYMRIQAILKRTQRSSSEQIGTYLFLAADLLLKRNENEVSLTQREGDILLYLLKNKNQVVKREAILKAIWGEDDYFMGRSLDVYISKLRKYLSSDESVEIKNIHGVGFKLVF